MKEYIGYHGTTKKAEQNILRDGFRISKKEVEWLGWGTYFFEDKYWATIWARQNATKQKDEPSILSAIIFCTDKDFLDLDVPSNMEKFNSEMSRLLSGKKNIGHFNVDDHCKLRCAACNVWAMKYATKIFAYTFPKTQYNDVGFPKFKAQRQFCVKESKNIREVKLEKMEDKIDVI